MYSLPKLKYELGALDPVISRRIMNLHYNRHHATYVDKLNSAIESVDGLSLNLEDALANLETVPESIRAAIRNNGGGHYNHSLFWSMMTPGGTQVDDKMTTFFKDNFGGLDEFKGKFKESALSVFGSGWAWLLSDGEIVTTPNQDSPLMDGRSDILLALDVWEHAYYLDYENNRGGYIDEWWGIVDWGYVSERLDS